MNRLHTSIHRQMELNQAKNLLFDHLAQIIDLEPGFLAALEQLIAEGGQDLSEAALQELVVFAAHTLVKRIYSFNQYLQIDQNKIHLLEGIYLHTWQRIVMTKDIPFVLRRYHYPQLSRWIADLYPHGFLEILKSRPVVGKVVYQEYSVQMQLDLLKIELAFLKEPLIDIGCGSNGALVAYMRRLGLDAYGIDRNLTHQQDYLQKIDWFDYSFSPQTWGTVISHMAFTNHLSYAYQNDHRQLPAYAEKYKEIVCSLIPGGSFYYAPGAPFLEQDLDPAFYRVETNYLRGNVSACRITQVGI